MTYRQFKKWCNERACDGMWSSATVAVCIKTCHTVDRVPFWKREREWQRLNGEQGIVENFVEPTNKKIDKLLKREEERN